MTVYRSPIEKILTEKENETVVTNPSEPGRTLVRKISYRLAVWRERVRRLFRARRDDDGAGD